jgi:uncharacterized UBP type Zn finger protein
MVAFDEGELTMTSVNYRSVVHELVEIECTPEQHKQDAANGEDECESCKQKIDGSTESGIKMTMPQYLMLKAVAAERIKKAEALSRRWSELHHTIEQDGFQRQADEEDGNYYEPEFDSDEEQAAYHARIQVRNEMRQIEMNAIEAQLDSLGARMARPYEHHNEDEAYFQYMEEGRFGDISY